MSELHFTLCSYQTKILPSFFISFLTQKVSIARWLHKMMEGGQEAVDDILRDPESQKQKYLAEQYQEVLRKHREW